jgi:hypothetical protein
MRFLATLPALLVTLTSCSGLQAIAPGPGPAAMAIVAPPPPDPHLVMIEDRKDDLLRRLATCESGGYGSSEKRIYGGRGLYHGRFQFMIRSLQGFVIDMDGRALTIKEATEIAHDYDQAAVVAKYAIFERGAIGQWPLCARKLGLHAEVRAIKAL